MRPIPIDILIFVAFFLLNIIVGFRYRGKNQSFKEYAIGDKKFSTATLTATLVATFTSGSVFFAGLENTYSRGLYYILATVIGATAGILITGRVVGPHMGKFLNHVSLPDALGKLYGKHVQLIAGLSCIILSVGYIAAQFRIMGETLAILFNYEGPVVVIIAATIVTLYSISGGVKAVTFTDVLQFFTFGTLLPILALTIWNNLQDQSQVMHVLKNNPLFNLREVVGWSPDFLNTLALMTYFIIPELAPELFQRLAMSNSTNQVKHSMTWAAVICLGLELCIIWIAILLLVDQPGLAPEKVVSYMANTHVYTGLKGFFGVGVLALAMSTADSTINSTAVIIANDILPPLRLQKEGSLQAAKNATLFLGFFSVLLALHVQGILDIILSSACFYAPIVVAPMLLAIFGFQTSRRVVIMAMGAGVTTVSILIFVLGWKEVISIPPSLLVNLTVMLGAHYLLDEEGGWGNNPLPKNIRGTRSRWIAAVQDFKLYPYLGRILPAEDHFYSLFGFYIFTATYASFYLLPYEITVQFSRLYSTMQYSVMLLFTTFLAFPIWPNAMKARRFLTWAWPLCAFYALFLVGGTLVVLSGFAKSQILIYMLNFVMAVLLFHWPVALAMAVSGIILVTLGISQYNTTLLSTLHNLDTMQFRISYGLLLFSSFLIALFKQKQAYSALERRNKMLATERKLNQEELVKALSHEARFFSEVTTAGTSVLEAVSKKVEQFSQQVQTATTPQKLTTVCHSLKEIQQALKDTMEYLKNVVYRVQGHLQLEVETVPIDNLLSKTLAVLKVQYAQTQPHIRRIANTKDLQCDPIKIQQLLVNALLYAQQNNSTQQPVFLDIQETTLGYPIPSVKDYIKEVPALCIVVSHKRTLTQPKKLYMGAVGNTSYQVPQSMEDLSLLDNQHIVDAHYGAVELIKKDDTSLTQIYVIPIHLREVRPNMMDLPQMKTGGLADEYSTVLPEETALLKRLQEKTDVDMELAEKAITYIKKYHGPTKRKTGEPFYLHPIAATEILLDYTEDQAAVLATLLHDTVEDTPLTLAEIGVVFGPDVSAIVNKVTHLDGQFRRVSMDTQENVCQLLEETDIRVLQVKLADRTHNMRTIEGHASIEKQQRIAEETLRFFVSMARQLGLKKLEEELQTLITAVMKNKP